MIGYCNNYGVPERPVAPVKALAGSLVRRDRGLAQGFTLARRRVVRGERR